MPRVRDNAETKAPLHAGRQLFGAANPSQLLPTVARNSHLTPRDALADVKYEQSSSSEFEMSKG